MNNLSIHSHMPTLQEFLLHSGEFISSLPRTAPVTIDEEYSSWKYIDSNLSLLFEGCEQELVSILREEWTHLKTFSNGKICSHVLRLLGCIQLDTKFQEMDEYDRNVILWTVVLHDLGKRGRPVIDGRDPFHPFASCAVTLQVFSRLGWVNSQAEVIESTVHLIMESYTLEGEFQYMDNSKLDEIIMKLLLICGVIENEDLANFNEIVLNRPREDLFCIEVLLLVLLHQSFTVVAEFPAHSPLTEDQLRKYCSPRLLKLLGTIMLNDSLSYLLSNYPKREQFTKEITESLFSLDLLIGLASHIPSHSN